MDQNPPSAASAGPPPGAAREASAHQTPTAPVAPRRPVTSTIHGHLHTDDWGWLRDREDPEVLAHLEEENAFTEASLAHLAPLRDQLFAEIRHHVVETDLSVPVRWGPWWYYQRTQEGLAYPLHCRVPATVAGGPDPWAPPVPARGDPGSDPGSIPPGAPLPGEQVLLDENQLAQGHPHLEVGELVVSPDHRWIAYTVDLSGAERFNLHFGHAGGFNPALASGPAEPTLASNPALTSGGPAEPTEGVAGEVVAGVSYGLAWASDSATVFYTRPDAALRPCELWRHRLGTDPAEDVKVLEEPDPRFSLSVGRTKDGRFVVAALHSSTTTECWLIPGDEPEAPPRVVARRRAGVEYAVDHVGSPSPGVPGQLVVLTNDGAEDFRVMVTEVGAPGEENWRELVPHRPGTRVEGLDVCAGWLVLAERTEAETRLRLAPLPPPEGDLLAASRLVPAAETPSSTWEGANPDPSWPALRYEQTSLVSPRAVFDLDLAGGTTHLRKRQPVRGYDPSAYRTWRMWATSPDGTAVPISLVARAEQAEGAGGPAPCVLYGYGSYEHSIDPAFSALRLGLLERGVVYALAHVRGGGEMGRRWYEEGKLARKPNSVADFVACARHLVTTQVSAPHLLAARGASAGGLLVGAAANEAPELFRVVVAEVPFVDCLNTMLDETLPLTTGEWEEWGDPASDPEAYATIRDYAPYENVRPTDEEGRPVRYPDILATAGLNDPRVGFWEPAKWVARIRAANPANRILLRTEMVSGHAGPSGRYGAWQDEAFVLAFLLDALGVTARPDTTSAT